MRVSRSSASTRLFSALMRIGSLRRRVAFHIRQHHFDDLQLQIPIGGGLACPIDAQENLLSFGEVFCEREYDSLLSAIPAPRRWLDVGAHAGYFSLFLATHAQGAGEWEALLVEPDPRLRGTIERGITQAGLKGRARLLPAAIGAGNGPVAFSLRDGMVSSIDPAAGDAVRRVQVPIASAAEIVAQFPPPYDLVKVDIEGAEYDFVRHYGELCRGARAMVVEWHAESEHADRVTELRGNLRRLGLVRSRILREPRRSSQTGPLAVTGVELFVRAKGDGG